MSVVTTCIFPPHVTPMTLIHVSKRITETEIDRVCAAYPHLNDDAFVARHREEWLQR